MKILAVFIFLCSNSTQAQDSNNGHTEHFITGLAIGGVTSYLVYRKTDDKLKSWLVGSGAAILAGLTKELIDPSIGGVRSVEDLGYSALGGVIGASIVFPLKKKKPKEVAYLF